ncbi:putative Acyltransferase 3 [Mesorhizobium plurifarium]|uniref:Putative Acyltransferase 3 n=1 Tax=Mesorhizobium plurifarium TaxID=69974 RepID=A0A0K2VMT5_MESPL|nr:putative Acyltransferase 3 [Mesorhizobium plurifarium]
MLRYRLIDICRGLAAFSVLTWHYQHFFYPTAGAGFSAQSRPTQPFYDVLWPLYEHGAAAVSFFWVLSGFVFAAVYLGRPVNARAFLVHRVARLYPLHLVTLLLVAALQWFSWQTVGHFQIYPLNDAYHFGLNLLMMQWWGFQSGFSFNAPTWSISVEVVIYGLFLVSLFGINKAPTLGAFLCAAAAILVVASGVASPFATCATFFFSGVVSYAILRRSAGGAAATAVLLIIVSIVSTWFREEGQSPYDEAALFSGIILLAGASDTIFPIRTARLDWFGDATYGTYLLHIPIQIAALTAFQLVGLPTADIAVQPWFFLAFIAVVFIAAIVVFRTVERPAQNWVKAKLGGQFGSYGANITSGSPPIDASNAKAVGSFAKMSIRVFHRS